MNTERTGCTTSTSSSSSPSLVAPTVGVKKEEEKEELPRVVSSSLSAAAAAAASSIIPSTRMHPMKKEEPEEGGDATATIGTAIGGNRRDGALRGVKKEEDDLEDDQQNSIPTATTIPASSSIIPDPNCSNISSNIASSNGSSDGMEVGNTDWRTGDWCWVVDGDEAHTHDDKEEDEEEAEDAKKSMETNTHPATVVASSAVGVKKEEQEEQTSRRPLQIIARSKATDPTRPDHITLCPRRTKYNDSTNTNTTTDIPSRTPLAAVAMVPDPIVSTNNNTHRDNDDNTDAMENVAAAAVGINTGTNKKRKSSRARGDHLKRKKSKSSIQATNNNNSSITNSDDLDTDDEMHDDDDDDDNYYDNDDDNDDDDNDDDDDDNNVVVPTNSGENFPNKREQKWTEMYKTLVAYKKEHKSIYIPQIKKEQRVLSDWVKTQRKNYNTNKSCLTEDRISKLNSIGFVWNAIDAQWMEMYERLVAYKKEYKTMCVSTLNPADPQLGKWVATQRGNFNTNQPCLTADRKTQLDSIGFVWNVIDAQWKEKYDRLVKYKEQNKTTCVPRSYPDDAQLGVWVRNQRSYYNTNKPRLTADRITRLASIGFVWNIYDAQWSEKFDRLVKYKKQNKTTCVPMLYAADPQLGRWVSHQRISYNTNQPSLTVDRITQLNSICFVWKTRTNNVYL